LLKALCTGPLTINYHQYIMKTQFYILMSLRTSGGFETYGQYFFGDDELTANKLFAVLNGNQDLEGNNPLHIDLMETVNNLPVKVKSISCTIDQLSANVKLITKEIFRQKNFKLYEE
jgi:hypothetical protein